MIEKTTNSFLRLLRVYDNDSQRTFDYLSKYYQNRPTLINDIISMFGDSFSKDSMKGKQIMLKPNWVKHDRNSNDFFCLRTQNDFLLAALESILQFNPSKIIIGDAPIQGCNWIKVCTPAVQEEIHKLS